MAIRHQQRIQQNVINYFLSKLMMSIVDFHCIHSIFAFISLNAFSSI